MKHTAILVALLFVVGIAFVGVSADYTPIAAEKPRVGNLQGSSGYFAIPSNTNLVFVATHTNGVALATAVTNTIDADITN